MSWSVRHNRDVEVLSGRVMSCLMSSHETDTIRDTTRWLSFLQRWVISTRFTGSRASCNSSVVLFHSSVARAPGVSHFFPTAICHHQLLMCLCSPYPLRMTSLLEVAVSRANAMQRRGRAGRTAPGFYPTLRPKKGCHPSSIVSFVSSRLSLSVPLALLPYLFVLEIVGSVRLPFRSV